MSLLLFLIILGVIAYVYVLPSIVAFKRQHPNRWVILIINVAFGATFLGWIIALVWAYNAVHRSNTTGSSGGESGLNLFANDVKQVRLISAPQETTPRIAISDAVLQIEKISDLLKASAISQMEFDILKTQIMSRVG